MPMHLSTLKALCQKPQMGKNKDLQLFSSFRNLEIMKLRRDGAALRYFDAEFTSSPYVLSFLKPGASDC